MTSGLAKVIAENPVSVRDRAAHHHFRLQSASAGRIRVRRASSRWLA
jgi:hypothetical protein